MHVALENRLFVSGHAEQRLQDARRVRMEAHDLAHTGAILEVHPPAALEPRDDSPRKRSHDCRIIVYGICRGRLAVGRRSRQTYAVSGSLGRLVLACEGLEVLAPLSPK